METLDVFRIALRWLHALAAVLWIGGSLFFWLVLRPGLEDLNDASLRSALAARFGKEFQGLVQVAIGVLIGTGALLGMDRLSQNVASPLYVALLGLKVALAVGMSWLALTLAGRSRSRTVRTPSGGPSPQSLILGLGLVVYLLAEALKVLFEAALRAV